MTVPLPVSATACGLPSASLVSASAALRAPAALGAKRSPTLQLPPIATGALHVLLEIAKSAAAAPVIAVSEIVSDALPGLVMVTNCSRLVVGTSWLRKSTDAGLALSWEATAVPLSGALCGLPEASSVIVSAADFAPVVVGTKFSPTVHEVCCASVVGGAPHVVNAIEN